MNYLIGKRFKAWDGYIYICDSYEPSYGLWMTREDAPDENKQDVEGEWRRNVSERAVGRTFHIIHGDEK